ncbi:Transposon Ty3-I Gag-Pol polyprotein [Vitis vinifera]|uniref:Transposon Ty3-I Gag-Pol polyprotein n=1 Tax=Vitis vinifera TaxID=29760 RepID=A0A438BXH3_VITVI|nr:Transposon Ty3-I Gag-Pol polyprotein [Vitis vinifera]
MNAIPDKELQQEEMLKKSTSPPFPQALHGKKGIRNASEILEVLRQVKVNIPLLDMIKQVPTYAKFLKDLLQDPGSPTISVMIGEKVVEKALLDLGASVNLLSYSVYKQLGLDFIVLDTDPTVKEANLVPIILGRPFIATSNAIINSTTPEEEEGLEEVCIIDTLLENDRRDSTLFNKEEEAVAEKETQKLNLKPLPVELKYTYLEEIINVLSMANIRLEGISPLVCTHHIYMEEEAKSIRQLQRRLNPHLQEVVRAEVLKLLQAGIIYPISDSPWVSPYSSGKIIFHCHFIDQVLERVSGHPFYCFLDGYSGYFQIKIDVEDQENTTFTCPFGTYAYRRMPFGLCNAPATFQRCMLSIFSDMVERIMEVFMDDITVYGGTFEECLINLEAVLHRCIEKDLVLNKEKCHFMELCLAKEKMGSPM